MELFKNEILSLRPLEPEDLDLLYQWENDSSLWKKGNTVSPYSRYVLKQYIAESHRGIYEMKQLRLMIEINATGQTAGMVDLYDFDPHNKKAGIGILIDKEHRQRGLGIQAINLMTAYAFHFLKIHQLYAYIAVDNAPSIALFTHCGFTLSGTLTDWIHSAEGYKDVHLYQKVTKE